MVADHRRAWLGTNLRAHMQGNLMTDEKARCKIHVAIDRNDMLGGENSAPLRLDRVVGEPTLRVGDDQTIDLEP